MNKKNLIIGGSIAAVALIGGVVLFGIASSGKASGDYANSPIETYSYKADASTTDKAFEFMGLSTSEEETIAKVAELTNSNSSFNQIIEDKQMTDGVISNHGIGFGNSGVIGYTFGDKATSLTVYDDAATVSNTSSLAAVLDLNMKVPVSVADVLRDHLAADAATELSVADIEAAEAGYVDAVMADADQKIDFAMSFGYFNYVVYSDSAKAALDANGFDTTGIIGGMTDEELATWYTTTFTADAVPTTSLYGLNVDGSSTPDPAMTIIIDAFNESSTFGFAMTEELNNNGSGSAWSGSAEIDIPGGPDSNTDNTGKASTFLGTQSRNTGDSDSYADWGYASGTSLTNNSTGVEIADTASYSTDGTILQTTMAIDSVEFFTAIDTKIVNPDTGVAETPIGITKDGLVEAYVDGVTWNTLATEGQLIFA